MALIVYILRRKVPLKLCRLRSSGHFLGKIQVSKFRIEPVILTLRMNLRIFIVTLLNA